MENEKNLSFRQIISVITPVLLLITVILSILWVINSQNFEPIITLVLILVAFLGIFIDRWIKLRETRKSLLSSLIHELYINAGVLADTKFTPTPEEAEKFTVFPRLSNFVVKATIISNAFGLKRDKKLFKLLHSWREYSSEFNKRLDITEIAMLNQRNEIKIWREKVRDGVTFSQVKESLRNIFKHLLKNYKNESGIDENTILFSE